MKIVINGECEPQELKILFESVGWKNQDSEKLSEIFSCSWSWITVRDGDGTLIGFARILSDGIRHAYICNMAISPVYQKRGIGKELMHTIATLLKENFLLPALVATPGNRGFYENFGFQSESEGFSALCLRKF